MERPGYLAKIQKALDVHPVVGVLGPRQCGKTTLIRDYIKKLGAFPRANYFDLEDPEDLARLAEPKLALSPLSGLIVIDEVQRLPEIFPVLRVLVDEGKDRKFLILGSASRVLISQSSESLAGRIEYIELTPFTLMEVPAQETLWYRGGFPRSYLAEDQAKSFQWRQAYIRTYLEQDIPSFGFNIDAQQMRRFWMMLTHAHGNICNYSDLGRSLNVSHPTIKHYIDILTSTFMIRQLQPWYENISKRQVKSPKIYFRDSGILHALLGVEDSGEVLYHPKLGASWEGFALEQVIQALNVVSEDCYFWATQAHAELDLLILKQGKRLGFEIKYSQRPKVSKSMKIALEDLKLDHLTIIYPGDKDFQLASNITVLGLSQVTDLLNRI